MRELEVRRHTMRTRPGKHLSQAGVDLARRVGDGMGRFDRVVTSTLPRAFETAIAMGFAVDAQLEALSEMGSDVSAEADWQLGFAEFARAARLGRATARFAREQAHAWQRIVESVPAGGRALVITHGGIVEAGTVGCLPDLDYGAWGAPCSFCEGVRLRLDAGRWLAAEVIRL